MKSSRDRRKGMTQSEEMFQALQLLSLLILHCAPQKYMAMSLRVNLWKYRLHYGLKTGVSVLLNLLNKPCWHINVTYMGMWKALLQTTIQVQRWVVLAAKSFWKECQSSFTVANWFIGISKGSTALMCMKCVWWLYQKSCLDLWILEAMRNSTARTAMVKMYNLFQRRLLIWSSSVNHFMVAMEF